MPSWLLGALTMAGMGIGFVLSRTTGLPGFHESEWELSGIVCLVLEAAFVAVAIPALAPRRDTAAPAAARNRRAALPPRARRVAPRARQRLRRAAPPAVAARSESAAAAAARPVRTAPSM